MQVTRIIEALRQMPEGADKEEAARMGFLEWLLTLPGDRSPVLEARAALNAQAGGLVRGGAPGLFLDYLEQTARAHETCPVRRGGRRARLH